ncbi:P-loop NTPase fold protein [uncultured Sphingomonas sp.]|uniref:KAP family P-loop NTPase fold protein n=1 Tax=uncultured Sphingomonas sp. TaxID=158754 RepID=UPI0025F721F2|nr:P-loop NTPase fold protein [uncultured Sphingomonas sp.]
MRLKNEIEDSVLENGFDGHNDLFGRKDLALRLIGLFESIEHGSVSVLDGRWGIGKTTFSKQLAAEFRKRGIPTIYFDAFNYDYIDSPFQAVASTFIKAAIEAKKINEPSYKAFLEKAASVGRTIAAASAKVGVKVATLGIVNAADLGDLGKVGETIVDGTADISEEAVKKLLEEQATAEVKFRELKSALEELPALLSLQQSDESVPLIVFVDELDRCRPDFALGILEVLKHFFRADGIHFILSANRSALEFSVHHKYGVGISAAEYLEKFFDFSIFLDANYDRYGLNSVSGFVSQTLAHLLPERSQSAHDTEEDVVNFSIAYRLTLRQIQSYCINVGLSFRAYNERELRPSTLIAFLCLIKSIRTDIFKGIKSQTARFSDIKSFIDMGEWEDGKKSHILRFLQYYSDPDINTNDEEWTGWGNTVFSYNIRRENVMTFLANKIVDRFGAPSERKPI